MAHYSEEKNGLDLADEKSDGKEGDNDERDAALVQAVKSFFYENQDFADIFEVFANENAHHIDLESEEYQLVYTELHEEFVRIFEEQMEGFIESQGSSAAEFYQILRRSADVNADSDESLLGQIMCATCDFDVFMMMMRETKRRADARARAASRK